jgi:hypothetical protein
MATCFYKTEVELSCFQGSVQLCATQTTFQSPSLFFEASLPFDRWPIARETFLDQQTTIDEFIARKAAGIYGEPRLVSIRYFYLACSFAEMGKKESDSNSRHNDFFVYSQLQFKVRAETWLLSSLRLLS